MKEAIKKYERRGKRIIRKQTKAGQIEQFKILNRSKKKKIEMKIESEK